MKILLTAEFFLSGQSTHVLDLAVQLRQLGHTVEIIFINIHTSIFSEYYDPMLKKARIKYYHTSNKTKIAQITRRFQPDIIHSHSSTIFNLTKNLAEITQTPYLVTCHGLGFSHMKYRKSLQNAERIITVGVNSAREILPLYKDKVIIIPNGIDIHRFKPAKKDTVFNVYYVGRIDWSKVYPLKELKKAVDKITHIRLIVVGNWQPPIKEIDFVPWQPRIENILKTANIVIGCGRSAREALACGCAVFLMNTKYDGLIDEILTQEPNFDFSGNIGRFNYDKLYQDLFSLISNRKRLSQVQNFSRQFAESSLSSLEMTKKILAVYEEILFSS